MREVFCTTTLTSSGQIPALQPGVIEAYQKEAYSKLL